MEPRTRPNPNKFRDGIVRSNSDEISETTARRFAGNFLIARPLRLGWNASTTTHLRSARKVCTPAGGCCCPEAGVGTRGNAGVAGEALPACHAPTLAGASRTTTSKSSLPDPPGSPSLPGRSQRRRRGSCQAGSWPHSSLDLFAIFYLRDRRISDIILIG